MPEQGTQRRPFGQWLTLAVLAGFWALLGVLFVWHVWYPAPGTSALGVEAASDCGDDEPADAPGRPWTSVVPSTGDSGLVRTQPFRPRAATSRYKVAARLRDLRGLRWTGDLALGLGRAAKTKKRVLLLILGTSHIRSDYLVRYTFAKPSVTNALRAYVLVPFYVDVVPKELLAGSTSYEGQVAEGQANNEWWRKVFLTRQVPHFVLFEPTGRDGFRTVASFGLYPDEHEKGFVEFLHKHAGKKEET